VGSGGWSNDIPSPFVLPAGATGPPEIILDDTTGKITVIAANGSRIEINPNNASPVIQFFSTDGTNDAFINAVVAGSATRCDLGVNSGKYDPGDGVTRRIRMFLDDSANLGLFEVVKESDASRLGGYALLSSAIGEFGWNNAGTAVKNKITFNATEAFASVGIKAEVGGVAETWHDVSSGPGYQNSWVNRGAGFPNLAYKKVAAPDSGLWIAGQASGGTIPTSVIFTLPTGYRPTTQYVVANTTGVFQVDTNGNVSVVAAGSAFVQVSTVIPLDH